MGIFKNRVKDPFFVKPSDATIAQCFKKGDIITKLSFFILGLGNLLNKQFARGIVFLAAEIAYIGDLQIYFIETFRHTHLSSDEHTVTMIYFMLDDLGRKPGKGLDADLQLHILIAHLDFFITHRLTRATQ